MKDYYIIFKVENLKVIKDIEGRELFKVWGQKKHKINEKAFYTLVNHFLVKDITCDIKITKDKNYITNLFISLSVYNDLMRQIKELLKESN